MVTYKFHQTDNHPCTESFVHHNGKCVHVSEEANTWYGAMEYCKCIGGSLIQITTATKNDDVKAVLVSGVDVSYKCHRENPNH